MQACFGRDSTAAGTIEAWKDIQSTEQQPGQYRTAQSSFYGLSCIMKCSALQPGWIHNSGVQVNGQCYGGAQTKQESGSTDDLGTLGDPQIVQGIVYFCILVLIGVCWIHG